MSCHFYPSILCILTYNDYYGGPMVFNTSETYLLNNIGQDRLIGLALKNIHRNYGICINKIFNIFARLPQ